MTEIRYLGRRAVQIENELLRVTSTVEGGHVAEIVHKPTGVNPLWTPHWVSIEPSAYDREKHPEYGAGSEAYLLAGILGHNICLDTFGAPSEAEAKAGIPVHGEGPVVLYDVSAGGLEMTLAARLKEAALRFERRITLASGGNVVLFEESVENLSALDRPIAWTEHVTLGAPFLERGQTQFRASATRSKVIGADFNDGKGRQQPDAEFDWPLCPAKDGAVLDLSTYSSEEASGGFTAHLMDPGEEHAWFMAWSPATKVLFGYVWKQQDFPWLGRWEENHLREQAPWNGRELTCGMEFGVSPLAESRREMVTRGTLFGVPAYRWAPARTRVQVKYSAFITTAEAIPESLRWDGGWRVEFL